MVRSGYIIESKKALRRSRSHQEDLLDEALAETFPASDPVAIAIEAVEPTQPSRQSDQQRPPKVHDAQSRGTQWRH